MADERIQKLANLTVNYCVDIKPKEKVIIQGNEQTFPLMHEIYKECLLRDAYPQIMAQVDTSYTFFKHAKQHQLTFVSPWDKVMMENVDARISIAAEANPKRLTNIDPARMTTFFKARKELSEIFYKRVAEKKLKWTAVPYPITAQAQEASMSLTEYEDFVYNSCLVDKADAIAEWKKIHQQQEKICKFLDQTSEIHIVGEDTDLTFNAKGRSWINCAGKENMPDGEVFTAPIENSVNGTIRFTFPGIVSGREVEDIKLAFKDGRVVKASAAVGDEFLQQTLKIEGADCIGEASIGTNYAITTFTKNMLFDEKMGGTIHMALGNSYAESGGKNKSAIHWDILKDMKKGGEIYADGKLFYKNGKFLI